MAEYFYKLLDNLIYRCYNKDKIRDNNKQEKGRNTMKIYKELDLESFEAWSGAVDTLEKVKEEGKCEELEYLLEELYPDGMSETELNDILWFEDDWIYETLGIKDEDEDEDEDEEEEDEEFELFCSQFADCKDCPYKNELTMQECKAKFHEEKETE